jgi:3-deoxy-D-manno-octulosonate 8-phosphate phosphatase (KDO 8-P phosphatase)
VIVREDAEARAKGVRLLLLDGDGVLSDGSIFVGPSGEEWKSFDARDGLGIRIAQRAGISFGIVTGRRSRALEWRANELRILELHQGVADKLKVFEAILSRGGIEPATVGYVGDDLVDVRPMRRSGFAATVPHAAEEIRQHAHVITRAEGGRGAVREVIEYVLKAQGRWQQVLEEYGVP